MGGTLIKIIDDKVEVDGEHGKVILEVGKEYVIDQLNPKASKNRGRRCIFLGVVEDHDGKDQKAKVKFVDNNRVGKAEFGDLAYVGDDTGYLLDLDFMGKNQAAWGVRDPNKGEYSRLWKKLLKRPERDMDLIMLGYSLAMIDFADFPAANWRGDTVSKKDVEVFVATLTNKIRTPSDK